MVVAGLNGYLGGLMMKASCLMMEAGRLGGLMMVAGWVVLGF